MTAEEIDLILKRKEMSKEAWIKSVMQIHPDKTREETERLWREIFESKKTAIRPAFNGPRNRAYSILLF